MHKYSYNVVWSEEDNCYIATSPEFRRVSAFGSTHQDALDELSIALEGVIETYQEEGWELPQPQKLQEHSGQFRVRLPKGLHGQLVQQAQRENVSLNTLVVHYLSASIAVVESKTRRHQELSLARPVGDVGLAETHFAKSRLPFQSFAQSSDHNYSMSQSYG